MTLEACKKQRKLLKMCLDEGHINIIGYELGISNTSLANAIIHIFSKHLIKANLVESIDLKNLIF